MTPTRWAIVAFWAFLIVFTGYYLLYYALQPAPPRPPEQHWLPAPLPNSGPANVSDQADVHLTHYIFRSTPGSFQFSVDLVVENRGSKKATAVQVQIHPYLSTGYSPSAPHGPDEIPAVQHGDPIANLTQWVSFPDVPPGQTATQTVTLPMRSDADAAQRDDRAQVIFETAKP